MRKKKRIIPLLLLCMVLMASCQCKHEWFDADCITAKTCSICGETEGTSLGHLWCAATCTEPKRCFSCGITEGDPLGHTPGKIEKSLSFDYEYSEQYCEICKSLIFSETTPHSDYIDEETSTFLFSPLNQLTLLEINAKQFFPDFCYEITDNNGIIAADIYWYGPDNPACMMRFFNADRTERSTQYANANGIWCVSFTAFGSSQLMGTLIHGDMLRVIACTFDPAFSDEDYKEITGMKLVTALNAIDFGEQIGHWINNNLLYEFEHILLSNEQTSDPFAIESFQIYASDYRTYE